MAAIINTGSSLARAFHYNENKLEAGAASALLMENYPPGIGVDDGCRKLKMLAQFAAIRPDVKVNSLHILLNFAPDEMISVDKMREIAKVYMERIGFGDQPFLVYRHHDSVELQ